METVIKLENVSKKYKLGVVGSDTLTDDLKVWWAKKRGKENPLLKIGEELKRTDEGGIFWALRDINFSVKKGEILGIIGKNGAGKSTLLKLLSQITAPSKGAIKVKGRIASLLEVGTGFHPELTGRENIYLNGAILGMNRPEIKSKIDEIIAFSGIEHHIDTPVKRYSSGMRVRLGFAVAAHLEPEILIIDEVLAVGDAEFQRKCIGKMKDVAGEGRTVLFVSHNMASVRSLCTRGMLLTEGKISEMGETDFIISKYLGADLEMGSSNYKKWKSKDRPGTNEVKVQQVAITAKNKKINDPISMSDPAEILVSIEKISKPEDEIGITLQFLDDQGSFLFVNGSLQQGLSNKGRTGCFDYKCNIPPDFFNEGNFHINLLLTKNRKESIVQLQSILNFTIVSNSKELGVWMGKSRGPLKPHFHWEEIILEGSKA